MRKSLPIFFLIRTLIMSFLLSPLQVVEYCYTSVPRFYGISVELHFKSLSFRKHIQGVLQKSISFPFPCLGNYYSGLDLSQCFACVYGKFLEANLALAFEKQFILVRAFEYEALQWAIPNLSRNLGKSFISGIVVKLGGEILFFVFLSIDRRRSLVLKYKVLTRDTILIVRVHETTEPNDSINT